MDELLSALKAAAEPTRLRLLALCAHGELTVSDLTQILGQSQPRVSRHLKMLSDAGLLERSREGTWAYFRLAERGRAVELARTLVDAIPADDPTVALDLHRLEAIKRARADAAAAYFRDNAQRWDEIRSLHVPEREVEAALAALVPETVGDLLDIGTGTGRMLALFGPRAQRALGIDQSREMLAVARANLDAAGLRHVQLRHGDMYHLALAPGSFDLVILHQVLHFAEHPAEAIAEAARVLRPGGRLLLADFARHDLEALGAQHAHRRLGFDLDEVAGWCEAAGLAAAPPVVLAGDPLTVCIWPADRPALRSVSSSTAPLAAGAAR